MGGAGADSARQRSRSPRRLKVGDRVTVAKSFQGHNQDKHVQLSLGERGVVKEVDADGDVRVFFKISRSQWILSADLACLATSGSTDAKETSKQECEPEKPSAVVESTAKKKGKAKKGKEDKPPPVPFKRIDDDKCRALIKDQRLLDNTHKAKVKFGNSAGDSWADKASEDLLKTRGKGFRKEMAKKKRASWRGGGAIDQGVNSVKFEDSSDEE